MEIVNRSEMVVSAGSKKGETIQIIDLPPNANIIGIIRYEPEDNDIRQAPAVPMGSVKGKADQKGSAELTVLPPISVTYPYAILIVDIEEMTNHQRTTVRIPIEQEEE
jgi:hypothetical protein